MVLVLRGGEGLGVSMTPEERAIHHCAMVPRGSYYHRLRGYMKMNRPTDSLPKGRLGRVEIELSRQCRPTPDSTQIIQECF